MRETKPEEIAEVLSRLDIFDGSISPKLQAQLETPMPRMQQHRLFWLLLNDAHYEPTKRALEILRQYGNQQYIDRAIRKLQEAADKVQYEANIAEIIAAAYYIEKFGFEHGKVEWERTVSETGNSVDITINGFDKPVNVEVTGLTESKDMRDFSDDSYNFKDRLRALVADHENPRFCYMVSLPENDFIDINESRVIKNLTDDHLQALADFIIENREQGPGTYEFTVDDTRISIDILELGSATEEYVESLAGWSGFIKDGFRMRSKVLEKAERQLPADDYNFVFVVNLARVDDDDYEEAMNGQFQIVFTPGQPGIHRTQRADNGVSQAIAANGLSPVHGLIQSGFDYFADNSRTTTLNPRTPISQEILDAIA